MKKNPLVVSILVLALALGFLTLGGLTYIYVNHHNIELTPAEFISSGEALGNPYCGWYRIYYYAPGNGDNDVNTVTEGYRGDRNRLALVEIDLAGFRDTDISDDALNELNEIFRAWELSDKNLIVRFLYDAEGNVDGKEPDSVDRIESHMDQVASVVNDHAALIYMLQGSFAGNYGEMHGGAYSDRTNMRELVSHLGLVVDQSIFLSVRTPSYYRLITMSMDPIAAENAFSGMLSTRVGLYNDGMTGSETDMGTYADVPWTDNRVYDTKGDRTQELAFQSKLCKYVPNGGEVVNPNKYNDFLNAVSAFSTMHVSYLDEDYDVSVLKKWKLYNVSTDDNYNGDTGYDYIGKHLGYRFFVSGISAELYGLFSNEATVVMTMDNLGYAPCYMPLDVQITILGTDNYTVVDTIDPGVDTRFFAPDEASQIRFNVPIDSLGKGDYTLYLKITDPVTGENIALDNINEVTGNYQDVYGLYVGHLSVDPD